MLDLETLGTGNNAAVVAIGACAFDPHGEGLDGSRAAARATFYMPVDVESAMKHGDVTASTIKWWLEQSDAARKSTFAAGAQVLPDVLNEFSAWLRIQGFPAIRGWDIAVWGNGATFDNVIIRSAYEASGTDAPWSFRNDKCYRTLCNLVPQDKRPALVRAGTAHNALDDAVTQALHLQKVYRVLGLPA